MTSSRLVIATLLSFLFSICSGNVVTLTKDNFDSIVDGSANMMVEFYAPWCGHCKNLAPEWQLASETFQPSDGVKFGAVDATENSALADKYGVKGYPTIKFFPKGSTQAQDYDGGRTADTLVKWVNEKTGTSRKVKAASSAVTVLTNENFDSVVGKGAAALVEFYAPWCGHCKQLAPKYEQLAQIYAGDSTNVVIAKVDATEESALGSRFEIQGYPTIKYFPAGKTEPEDYQGGRELDDFVSFINSNAGTQRNVDGSLKSTAGRIEALDKIIANSEYSISAPIQEQLEQAAIAAVNTPDAAAAKIYASIAKNIHSKGPGYIGTELGRMTKMLSGSSLKPEAKKNFQLRQNILAAFLPPKSSVKESAAEEEL